MPRRDFDNQEPVRRGNAEFIDVRGVQKIARTWDPAELAWRYTRLGLTFFRRRRVEYVVDLPVTVVGRRQNGTYYERSMTMPVSSLGIGRLHLPAHLDSADAERLVKSRVLDALNPRRTADGLELYQYSEEIWFLDESGDWKISSMEAVPIAAGTPEVRVVLDRPLRHLPSVSDVLNPQDFIPEAFEFGNDCVARQLSAALPMDRFELEGILSEHVPMWAEVGVSANQVIELCQNVFRCPCYVVMRRSLVHIYRPPAGAPHRRGIAFAVVGSHMMMYKSCRVVAQMHLSEPSRPQRVSLPYELKSDAVVFWKPWAGDFEAGHYYSDNVDSVRRQFLESGRSPRLTMLSACEVAKLTYTLTAYDGLEVDPDRPVEIVVHRWPCYAGEMQDLLEALRRDHGLDMGYRGESLASLMQRVFGRLLRLKRTSLSDSEKREISAAQDNCCNSCGGVTEAEERQFDHVSPLRDLSARSQECIQMLCASCHQEKTNDEPRCDRDVLLSSFSKTAFDAYVLSPSLPQLQCSVNVPQGVGS